MVYNSIDELMAQIPCPLGSVKMYHPRFKAADGNNEAKAVRRNQVNVYEHNGWVVYREKPSAPRGVVAEPVEQPEQDAQGNEVETEDTPVRSRRRGRKS